MSERQLGAEVRQYTPPPEGPRQRIDSFTRRAVITVGIVTTVVLVLLFLWNALDVLTLVFAGILLATFLRGLSDLLTHYTRLPPGLSLAVVVLGLLGTLGIGIWQLAPAVTEQLVQLQETLPQSIRQVENFIAQYELGRQFLDQLPTVSDLVPEQAVLFDQVTGIFSTTVGALVSFVIILFVGLYLAIDPRLYVNGLVRLVPISRRDRFREMLGEAGQTLKWWLIGRAMSMLTVGIMVSVGLWILDVPLALTLGILAALFDFIPNVGPVLATAPAVLIALVQSPTQALYVLILYIVIQQIESYLITPIVQQQTVKLPPALTVVAQLLLTLLLGGIGLVIASPLVAVAMVMVRMLYVEDVLGDREVSADRETDHPAEPDGLARPPKTPAETAKDVEEAVTTGAPDRTHGRDGAGPPQNE